VAVQGIVGKYIDLLTYLLEPFFFHTCLKHFVIALVFFLCCQKLPYTPPTHKGMVFHQCKAKVLECALDKVNEDACKWDCFSTLYRCFLHLVFMISLCTV